MSVRLLFFYRPGVHLGRFLLLKSDNYSIISAILAQQKAC